MVLLNMGIYSVLFENLYTIVTNSSFKMLKRMRFLRSSKCSKTTVELKFTKQKANACSPWTSCSVFDWKYPFWEKFGQKLKIISLGWNLVLRLIQICRIPCWCSLFLFYTRKISFWANLVQKFKIGVHLFCFRSETSFFGNLFQKLLLFVEAEI